MCDGRHDDALAATRLAPRAVGQAVGQDEPLGLEPVESVVVTTLVDNVIDVLMTDTGPARRLRLDRLATAGTTTLEQGVPLPPVAEHGFSALVEVRRSGGTLHRILFDTGVSPDGMVENMRRLELSPGDVEVVVCSHGHFDHTTGLDGFVRAVGRASLPVLIHPEFWSRRRLAVPGRDPFELPTTSRRALVDAGFEIIERQQPSFLFEQSVLITGEVDRTTEFETGFPVHQAWRDGDWQPDPLILDDQALVLHVRGKGLVVLTGCGHAGVVNILRYVQRLTGVGNLHAVIGGFHLTGALFEPIIPPTVAALADLGPDVIVPAHCTGWRAVHAIAARLPDAFVPNSVGTRFELEAVPDSP
jgi:7,8-dihydropterin-6-yl-methyl-4-(beta-D-ribofuranosyl)aminobenzene 5'-phosphate synthase